MRMPGLALAAVAAVAAVLGCTELAARKEPAMGTQSAKAQEGKPFHIFNPETMAKPTVGYSQVAEVGEGKIVLRGRLRWTRPEIWLARTIFERRCSRFLRT
jgi:hypothetical protein